MHATMSLYSISYIHLAMTKSVHVRQTEMMPVVHEDRIAGNVSV